MMDKYPDLEVARFLMQLFKVVDHIQDEKECQQ